MPEPADVASVSSKTHYSPFCTPNGCTLLIASRNVAKGKQACKDLVDFVIESDRQSLEVQQSSRENEDVLSSAEYTKLWLQNLEVEFLPLDLSSIESILACAKQVLQTYPYITHLLLNAGVGPFVGINWLQCVWDVMTDPVGAFTWPAYNIEKKGLMTDDGLG